MPKPPVRKGTVRAASVKVPERNSRTVIEIMIPYIEVEESERVTSDADGGLGHFHVVLGAIKLYRKGCAVRFFAVPSCV